MMKDYVHIWQVVVYLDDAPVLPEVLRLLERLLQRDGGRQPNDVHQVALHHPHVPQRAPVERRRRAAAARAPALLHGRAVPLQVPLPLPLPALLLLALLLALPLPLLALLLLAPLLLLALLEDPVCVCV